MSWSTSSGPSASLWSECRTQRTRLSWSNPTRSPTPKAWLRYEHFIRRAAGIGRASQEPDPDRYEHQYAHCDMLVIGAGVAGLAAARRAADAGARVIVCQQSPHFGGGAVDTDAAIDERSIVNWTKEAVEGLAARAGVTLLSRTTAFGYYDDNLVAALERVTDHVSDAPQALPRERMWMIRAKSVVLASGAIERPIAYGGNDRPGTLLAGAARTYVRRHAVRLGTRAVVFTNNDAAYASALALHDAGIAIAAIVDARPESKLAGVWPARARASGLTVRAASAIVRAHDGQWNVGRQRQPRI